MEDSAFQYSREIDDKSLSFLSEYTKNPNLAQLREHVLKVKENLAASFHVYRCIDRNMFLFPRILRHTTYEQAKATWQSHYQRSVPFKIADVGCCFGTDTRQLLHDGVHPQDIYAIDVHDGYWEFGLQLFGDKDALKVNTLFTDVSVPDFGEKHSDLNNKFNYVYTGAVLHVFAKDEAEQFVRNIYNMLVYGGTYFGSAGVAVEPTQTTVPTPKKDKHRYLHSPESVEALLKEVGFVNVKVVVSERKLLPTDDIPNLPMKKYVTYSATRP